MLAVTGATGQIGGRVAARLASLGLSQRLIVRDPSRAPRLPVADIFQVSSYGTRRLWKGTHRCRDIISCLCTRNNGGH
jgi:nucleoside-diphosphate-sugar epimerase